MSGPNSAGMFRDAIHLWRAYGRRTAIWHLRFDLALAIAPGDEVELRAADMPGRDPEFRLAGRRPAAGGGKQP